MPRRIREFMPLFVAFFPYLFSLLGFYFEYWPLNNYVLALYTISLLALYAAIIQVISAYLEPSKISGELASISVFIFTSVLLVGGFGFAWEVFDLFKSSNPSEIPTKLDAYYFSVVSFTTIGFGDFVPSKPAGKVLLGVEALMGAAHMVAFFSIVISRAKAQTCPIIQRGLVR